MAETLKQTINFDLVSPEAKLVSGPVKMAVIPGVEGEMGVGAGHSSFVVALKAGIVKLYDNDNQEPRRIFIAGGFADVTGENCAVLAEEAIEVARIDADAAQRDVKILKDDHVAAAQGPLEQARLETKLAVAKARLSAVTGKLVI